MLSILFLLNVLVTFTPAKQTDEMAVVMNTVAKKETVPTQQEKVVAQKELQVDKTNKAVVKNTTVQSNESPKQGSTQIVAKTTTQPVELQKETKTIPEEKGNCQREKQKQLLFNHFRIKYKVNEEYILKI